MLSYKLVSELLRDRSRTATHIMIYTRVVGRFSCSYVYTFFCFQHRREVSLFWSLSRGPQHGHAYCMRRITLLGQSAVPVFGDKPLELYAVCPQNETATLKGLQNPTRPSLFAACCTGNRLYIRTPRIRVPEKMGVPACSGYPTGYNSTTVNTRQPHLLCEEK